MRTAKLPPPPPQASFFPTPLGEMAIAWEGNEVVGTFLPEAGRAALLRQVQNRLAGESIAWNAQPPPFVLELAAAIRSHLQGEPQAFPLARLALARRSPFFRRVYECASRIPAGETRTYGALAAAAGSPGAARAVGQAMARNPFPLVIPCHRVTAGGNKPGGFSAHGGLATKARLLALESARPADAEAH